MKYLVVTALGWTKEPNVRGEYDLVEVGEAVALEDVALDGDAVVWEWLPRMMVKKLDAAAKEYGLNEVGNYVWTVEELDISAEEIR